MRKISSYARKRRMGIISPVFDGAAWANVIQRCRPYSDEIVIPLKQAYPTQVAADKALILVMSAFDSIANGMAESGDSLEYDRIAHALGVTYIRAVEIAGEDETTNEMLPILSTANAAMNRVADRYERIGKWGFDGPALEEIKDGLAVYETVLKSSSPAQMTAAADARIAILDKQGKLK